MVHLVCWFGITGAQWCDFVVYTFKGPFVQRIAKNEAFWQDMSQKLEHFFFEDFLPLVKTDDCDG